MSAFINGLVILIVSLCLMFIFGYMPEPLIAAILVNTAFRMVPFKDMGVLFKRSKE